MQRFWIALLCEIWKMWKRAFIKNDKFSFGISFLNDFFDYIYNIPIFISDKKYAREIVINRIINL